MSEDVRALLAATAADVCEVARAPFCALNRLHGDDAVIAAVQGARSHGAPHAGTSWRISDVPPARQAVVTGRAVTLARLRRSAAHPGAARRTHRRPPARQPRFHPALSATGSRSASWCWATPARGISPKPCPSSAPSPDLAATVLDQDDRLEDLARAADDLALVLDADIEAQSRSAGPEQVLRVIGRRLAELCHTPLVDIFALEDEELRCVVRWQRGTFRPDHEGTIRPLADWPLTHAAAVSGRLEVVPRASPTRAWQPLPSSNCAPGAWPRS